MRLKDLSGQRFGMLTVTEYIGGSKWKCKCDCGNETIVFAANLERKHTKSCGCLKGEGLIGKKVGKMTILKQIDKEHFLCRCDCGNEEIRVKTALYRGDRKCFECAKKVRHEARENSEIMKADYVNGTQLSLIGKKTKANKSGHVGVNWDKSRGKWQASIRYQGKKYNIGRFESIQDAIDARKNAELELLGEIKSE